MTQEDSKSTTPVTYAGVHISLGQLLDTGASGVLELLDCGDVVKSPWPGKFEDLSRRDITLEYEIYSKLGRHHRLVDIVAWDPKDCVLTMEHMQNGNLHNFLLGNDKIAEVQRLRWVHEAAEGVQLLHDADIIHCDINPKNLLLDAQLGLRIADFSGSSLAGSKPSACSGKRFLIPGFDWRAPPTVKEDLFALGTTMYFIMTCQVPFPELSDDEVEENYRNHKFPDVSKIVCGEAIKQCWTSQIASAREIVL